MNIVKIILRTVFYYSLTLKKHLTRWNGIFLFSTLMKFNFGSPFISWIKISYTNPYFHVKNNGWISKKCYMSRGITQGCPVSVLLFLFVMEILSIKINNTSIKGFKLENMERNKVYTAR